MSRALLYRGILLHDDAAADLAPVAARQTALARLGLHLRRTITACCAASCASACASTATPVHNRADAVRLQPRISWADILVIGSIAPVAFVAKREVASWPLVGITAKLQRTVFVDRTRAPSDRRRRRRDRQTRWPRGVSVVLFAEGTSSDGNRVLPFRSALLGAVEERRAARRRRRRHPDPADVDQLHRPARHSDGPPAPPAGGLVRRSRLHAAHQGLHRTRRGRCCGQLWRAGSGERRHRPQGHDQDGWKARCASSRPPRCAGGRCPPTRRTERTHFWAKKRREMAHLMTPRPRIRPSAS